MTFSFSVVANTLMLKEASNIFFPQFLAKQAPRVLQQTIESWCSANKLEATSIDDANKLAMSLEVRCNVDPVQRNTNLRIRVFIEIAHEKQTRCVKRC